MKPLRVLIACEESGVMRRAFSRRGHDAWSCDLKPARDGSNKHLRGDVRDYLGDGWDLLMVAHPPCTRLCNSGVRWLKEAPKKLNPENYSAAECLAYAGLTDAEKLAFMWESLRKGAALFSACWQAPIERVAVENPIMHGHAKALMPADLPAPQIVQPYWFGEEAFKGTGFYLRGLPKLTPTKMLTPPKPGTEAHKAWSAIHRATPGPKRSEFRSATFQGIADACADQWGGWAEEALRA